MAITFVDLGNTLFYNRFPQVRRKILMPEEENTLANETGKRYSCGKCGAEFVVTRGAEGSIECCGEPMVQK